MQSSHARRNTTLIAYIIQFENRILAVTIAGLKQREWHISYPLLLLTFPTTTKWLLQLD